METICKEAEKFKIGDAVTITRITRKGGMAGSSQAVRLKAKVLERYPYHLVVSYGKFTTESISYVDAIALKLLKHTRGRKRKELAG